MHSGATHRTDSRDNVKSRAAGSKGVTGEGAREEALRNAAMFRPKTRAQVNIGGCFLLSPCASKARMAYQVGVRFRKGEGLLRAYKPSR